MTRIVFVCAALSLLLAAPAPAFAYKLSPADLEELDAPSSRYKVSPEMEGRIRALLDPYDLDATLPGDWVLEGISIEKFTIRLVLEKGDESFSVYLLPPVVEVDEARATPSFKIVADPGADEAATTALLTAIARNDQGRFWPDAPPAAATSGARRIAPSVRKVHFTELMGDFFLVVLIIAFIAAMSAFRQEFRARPLSWWWVLLGVTVFAAVVRIILYATHFDGTVTGAWSPSDELGHVSVAWYLNTIGRFSMVTLSLVTLLNVIIGALTVAGVFLLFSMLFEGLLPPLLAALVLASSPAHVALSASVTVMIPFLAFLVWLFVAVVLYVRTGDLKAHLLAAVLALFAVFARPEGILLVLPVLAWPFLRIEWREWRRLSFWLPALLVVAVLVARALTLPRAPQFGDPFLQPAFDAGALFGNMGVWLFNFGRVSFAAMLLWAMGVAVRPWKPDRALSVLMLVWFLVGLAIYFRVDMTNTLQGGRVGLFFLLPLSFLAAAGGLFLARLQHRRKGWAIGVIVLWLLLTPLIHSGPLTVDFRATYETNFLLEA